ncbi:flagellar motor protein MotB [Oceanimonas sp. CHS3-5]|uniref:flagellar motor protein MotB n=1 Tax=Oceanimonas sp. CHS3-5 TaxID=3068186 RepID=UPI00273DCB9D|nr:flagellar motor protein MotB [Oceanimonas sp. CHS3-5]MDP5290734.1 flagellar motor protein MotB [Oceanimonas sp. CHS3-5]
MRRRSLVPAHHDQHTERWLVSYADYMTLAFALFVMLYAVHASRSELRQPVVEGVQQALGQLGMHPDRQGALKRQGQPALPVSEQPAATFSANRLHEFRLGLGDRLAPLTERGLASIELGEEELVLTLDGSLLFAEGSALLGANSEAVFAALLPLLAQDTHFLRVRGFADNIAVSNELYVSNWQLSAERARVVLERLAEGGVAPQRLVLEAYGQYRPASRSRGDDSRSLNRRVEIAVSSRRWQPPEVSAPARTLPPDENGGLNVYELPGGGIRITNDRMSP